MKYFICAVSLMAALLLAGCTTPRDVPVASVSHAAASPAADLPGWGDVAWGMSQAQVKEKYPGARTTVARALGSLREDKGSAVAQLELEHDLMGQYRSLVFFFFNTEDQLYAVSVWPIWLENIRTKTAAFDVIDGELQKKYGQPVDLAPGKKAVHSWTLGRGSILEGLVQQAREDGTLYRDAAVYTITYETTAFPHDNLVAAPAASPLGTNDI